MYVAPKLTIIKVRNMYTLYSNIFKRYSYKKPVIKIIIIIIMIIIFISDSSKIEQK